MQMRFPRLGIVPIMGVLALVLMSLVVIGSATNTLPVAIGTEIEQTDMMVTMPTNTDRLAYVEWDSPDIQRLFRLNDVQPSNTEIDLAQRHLPVGLTIMDPLLTGFSQHAEFDLYHQRSQRPDGASVHYLSVDFSGNYNTWSGGGPQIEPMLNLTGLNLQA